MKMGGRKTSKSGRGNAEHSVKNDRLFKSNKNAFLRHSLSILVNNLIYPFHKKSAENVKRDRFKIEIMFDLVYIETQTKRNELGRQKYIIKTMREGREMYIKKENYKDNWRGPKIKKGERRES